jgi:hypothetical protein
MLGQCTEFCASYNTLQSPRLLRLEYLCFVREFSTMVNINKRRELSESLSSGFSLKAFKRLPNADIKTSGACLPRA